MVSTLDGCKSNPRDNSGSSGWIQDTHSITLSDGGDTNGSLRSEASVSTSRPESASATECLVEVLNLHHIRVHDPLEDELRYPVADLDCEQIPSAQRS